MLRNPPPTFFSRAHRRLERTAVPAGIFAVALLAMATTAVAKPSGNRIDGKGIGGVNLNLRRGPLVVRGGRHTRTAHTVDSMLGKPQSVHALPGIGESTVEKLFYLANYTDEKLSVYYSKRDAKGGFATKRGPYDRVEGVVTYTSKYAGHPQPGQPFPDADASEICVPLDAHVAPDEGPRRSFVCPYDPPGNSQALGLVYLSGGSRSRAGQVATEVGVFKFGVGNVIYIDLMAGALEDLNCENPQCT
jgi:hypothetical protein